MLSYIWNRKFTKWCLTFCCNRCILKEGDTNKNAPDKTPGQIPTRTMWVDLWSSPCPWKFKRELVQVAFVQVFCTRPTKSRGSEMCGVLLGGPGMCDKVWQGHGDQNWPKIARRILYGRLQTPQLTKCSCDLQMDVHNNRDRNDKTITKKQEHCCY